MKTKALKTRKTLLGRVLGAASTVLLVAAFSVPKAHAMSMYCVITDDGCNWSVSCTIDLDDGNEITLSASGYDC
ncbi:hypothetical protein [Thermogutta sp.]|uniref:hypothetical protein n=1 Tax=Thermogutta sp. TaxID=1962930 RepID=UPI003220599F